MGVGGRLGRARSFAWSSPRDLLILGFLVFFASLVHCGDDDVGGGEGAHRCKDGTGVDSLRAGGLGREPDDWIGRGELDDTVGPFAQGYDSREFQFMQAERLMRSVLDTERDAKKKFDMKRCVRQILEHTSVEKGAGQEGWGLRCGDGEEEEQLFGKEEMRKLREEVKEAFKFSFDNYMHYAYPHDELKPLTCRGKNLFGPRGYRLTLIDAMDTFVVLGNITGFAYAVKKVCAEVTFDVDANVSVFETNIRALGGLLSAHFFAENLFPWYRKDSKLLELAVDLGNRLLPAFNTATGIPYGTVNLRHGVPSGETLVTSTAGGGTVMLEFAMLSRATGDARFEEAARKATVALWSKRSRLGLVGNHINIDTGAWTHQDAGLGTNMDSFYEYLIKTHLLFGDGEFLAMFNHCFHGIIKFLKKGAWYLDVNMHSGSSGWNVYSSLASFWPGVLVLVGDIESAIQTQFAIHSLWRTFGGIPEGYNLESGKVHQGSEGYPLRPEFVESVYYLHLATGDPVYLSMGVDVLQSLQRINRVPCGYAATRNVALRTLEDRMDSYFLAETVKYLYLLFDEGHWLRKTPHVFNTEGHPFPIRLEFLNKGGGPGGWSAGKTGQDGGGESKPLNMYGMCPLPDYRRRISAYGFDLLSAEAASEEDTVSEQQSEAAAPLPTCSAPAATSTEAQSQQQHQQRTEVPHSSVEMIMSQLLADIELDGLDRLVDNIPFLEAPEMKEEEGWGDEYGVMLINAIRTWVQAKIEGDREGTADALLGGMQREAERHAKGAGVGEATGAIFNPDHVLEDSHPPCETSQMMNDACRDLRVESSFLGRCEWSRWRAMLGRPVVRRGSARGSFTGLEWRDGACGWGFYSVNVDTMGGRS